MVTEFALVGTNLNAIYMIINFNYFVKRFLKIFLDNIFITYSPLAAAWICWTLAGLSSIMEKYAAGLISPAARAHFRPLHCQKRRRS